MTTALRVGELGVTFQRYLRPASGVLDSPPRSWGALPVGSTSSGDVLLPLADDEAIWLGLSVEHPERVVLACIALEVATGEVVDAVTGESNDIRRWRVRGAGLIVPPSRAADGIRRNGRVVAFTRVASGEAPAGVALTIVVLPARLAGSPRRSPRPESQYAFDDRPEAPEVSPQAIGTAADDGWIRDEARSVRIRLVDQQTFAVETGLSSPGPLRPDAAYQGWKLP